MVPTLLFTRAPTSAFRAQLAVEVDAVGGPRAPTILRAVELPYYLAGANRSRIVGPHPASLHIRMEVEDRT